MNLPTKPSAHLAGMTKEEMRIDILTRCRNTRSEAVALGNEAHKNGDEETRWLALAVVCQMDRDIAQLLSKASEILGG